MLFIKTSFINNTYNTLKISVYIQEVSSLSYFFFDFAPVKRQKKTNPLEIEHEIICFMFRNNFFHKNTMEESEAPSLLYKEKRECAKSDVSKMLFPKI